MAVLFYANPFYPFYRGCFCRQVALEQPSYIRVQAAKSPPGDVVDLVVKLGL